MFLIADKNEVPFIRKHVNDMRHNRLSFNFYQWLGDLVTRATKSLTKTRHRNNYLQNSPLNV